MITFLSKPYVIDCPEGYINSVPIAFKEEAAGLAQEPLEQGGRLVLLYLSECLGILLSERTSINASKPPEFSSGRGKHYSAR